MYKRKTKKIICGIYKITSPNNKIYIGQSIDIYKRESIYRLAHCKKQTYLYHSIKKYGWETHKFEVIHECQREDLNRLEKYYVDLFQTFSSQNGLNVKDGGGNRGKMAEETKRKIGLKSKGRKFTDEVKKRIGYLSSLKKLSTEHRSKFVFTGRKHTEENKLKMSVRNSGEGNPMFGTDRSGEKNSMYGRKHRKETKDKMSKIILNTETGVFYFGIMEAADSIGMVRSRLRNRLMGLSKNKTSLIFV